MSNKYINSKKIREYLKKNKITQKDWAEKIGLSAHTLNNVIRRGTASTETVGHIATGMGVSPQTIVTNPNSKKGKRKLNRTEMIKKHKGELITAPCIRNGQIVTGEVVGMGIKSVIIQLSCGRRECVALTALGYCGSDKVEEDKTQVKHRKQMVLTVNKVTEERNRAYGAQHY